MTAFFSGPWLITAVAQSGFYTDYFEITYSDDADGVYEPAGDGTPYSVTVSGDAWTIDFASTVGADEEMSHYDPHRLTRTIPGQGLTVAFSGPPDQYFGGAPWVIFGHGLQVELISQDPHLTPPWEPPPFKFTIPTHVPGVYVPPA